MKKYGEVPVAFVELKPYETATEEDIKDFASGK